MDRPTIIVGLLIVLFCVFQCLNCWAEYHMTSNEDDEEEQIVEIVNAVPMTPRSAEEVHVKIKL